MFFILYLKVTSLKDLKEKGSIKQTTNDKLCHIGIHLVDASFKKSLWIIQFRAILFVLFKNL